MQHLFAIVLSFFTGIVGLLPGHHNVVKPVPTPASVSVNVITPTPTNIPTITPTDIPVVINTATPTPTPETVDCTGVDGKHMRVTQRVCDDFNRAWGNNTTPLAMRGVYCNLGGKIYYITQKLCSDMQPYYATPPTTSSYNTYTPLPTFTPEPSPIPVPTLPTYPGGFVQCTQDRYDYIAARDYSDLLGSVNGKEEIILPPNLVSYVGLQAHAWCGANFAMN